MAGVLNSRGLALTIVEAGSLVVLNVLSLIGNTLVCISVYRNARLRTTTNLYIIALAVSDLLSAVLVMPPGVVVLIAGEWIFGETVCQLQAFFSLFVIYVSPVTMGLTAVNRFVRMCKTEQQYNRLFSARKSRILLASVWTFVACFILVPRLSGLQAFEFVPGYAQCSIAHLSESGKMINYCFVLILFFITPLIATVFSYTRVAKTIRQHNMVAVLGIHGQKRNRRVSLHEIKLSKSLFAVVFAFMVCWIPFWIIVILRRFHLVASMPRNVSLLIFYFLYFSNTINPFIYAGMNSLFKREFRSILCCKSGGKVANRPTSDGSKTGEINTSVSRRRQRRQEENQSSETLRSPGGEGYQIEAEDAGPGITGSIS